jgi:hypothetical protein
VTAREIRDAGELRIASKIDIGIDRRRSEITRQAIDSLEEHWRSLLVREMRGLHETIREQAELIKRQAELLDARTAPPAGYVDRVEGRAS